MTKHQENHYKQLLQWLDEVAKYNHPDYGPCDALRHGGCSECYMRAFEQGMIKGSEIERGL